MGINVQRDERHGCWQAWLLFQLLNSLRLLEVLKHMSGWLFTEVGLRLTHSYFNRLLSSALVDPTPSQLCKNYFLK